MMDEEENKEKKKKKPKDSKVKTLQSNTMLFFALTFYNI